MKEKTTYLCENCGQEFENGYECEKHEDTCLNKIELCKKNVQAVIDKIKQEYGSLITNITSNVIDNSFDVEGIYQSNFEAHVSFTLSNQNKSKLEVDPLFQDDCYTEIKKEIENKIPTVYEGIINWDYGSDNQWRTNYLGGTDLEDIVDRLRGRKVRLEVINKENK